jgi:hypothetical protein
MYWQVLVMHVSNDKYTSYHHSNAPGRGRRHFAGGVIHSEPNLLD